MFIAFLYQSTLMCGMEGGFRLKEPEIEKCGNLMCGRLQLKLKIPFSLFTMPCTKDHTPLNTLVKVDLIPFRILLTVDFTLLKAEDTVDFTAFTTEENEQINIAVGLSGLPKQEYCYRKCLNREIIVQGNPKVYKALRNQLAAVLDELKRIEAAGELRDELLENIELITRTLYGMKEGSE